MLYTDFEVGGKEYKLRLTTRNIVTLEKLIGCNPLAVFGDSGDTMPTITVMVAILHASLQHYQHGISMNVAYEIFDNYLADGNSAADFISVIMEIYKVSGIVPNDNEVKN